MATYLRHSLTPPLIRELGFPGSPALRPDSIGHVLKTVVMNTPRSHQRKRPGQTLLELVAATTILTLALVPALGMMRDAIRVGRNTETANLMTTFCASKLEEHLMKTAAVWNPSTATGNFSTEGYANLRYQVIMSDLATDGGIANQLMAIAATVWNDLNADGDWDAGEPRVVLASKQAQNVSYQQEASGS